MALIICLVYGKLIRSSETITELDFHTETVHVFDNLTIRYRLVKFEAGSNYVKRWLETKLASLGKLKAQASSSHATIIEYCLTC